MKVSEDEAEQLLAESKNTVDRLKTELILIKSANEVLEQRLAVVRGRQSINGRR